MTIEFMISIDDVLAFNKLHQVSSPSYLRQVTVIRYVGALAFLGIPFLFGAWELASAIAGIVVSLLWYIFIPRFMEYCSVRVARKLYEEGRNSGILGWHRLTLSDDGLREENDTGEQFVRYSGIERISEHPGYVFVYIAALQAHVIPQSAVRGDFESFMSALRSRASLTAQ